MPIMESANKREHHFTVTDYERAIIGAALSSFADIGEEAAVNKDEVAQIRALRQKFAVQP